MNSRRLLYIYHVYKYTQMRAHTYTHTQFKWMCIFLCARVFFAMHCEYKFTVKDVASFECASDCKFILNGLGRPCRRTRARNLVYIRDESHAHKYTTLSAAATARCLRILTYMQFCSKGARAAHRAENWPPQFDFLARVSTSA